MKSGCPQKLQAQYLSELNDIARRLAKGKKRSVLDDKTRRIVVSALLSGIPRSKAASILGLAKSTLYHWLKRFSTDLKKDGASEVTGEFRKESVQTIEVKEQNSLQDINECSFEVQIGELQVRILARRAA